LAQTTDVECSDIDERLRPAILATQTAAALHEGNSEVISDVWAEVFETASRHPDERTKKRLVERGIAGQIASSPLRAQRPSVEQYLELERLWVDFSHSTETDLALLEQRAASLCAGVEGFLEVAENDRGLAPPSLPLIAAMEQLSNFGVSPSILAFALCLVGRALVLNRQWKRAVAAFELAEATVRGVDFPVLQCWADWRAPVSLRDRVRLEWLRCIPPEFFSAPESRVVEWQDEATDRLDLIDAERLVSRILDWRLSRGIVSDLAPLKIRDCYNSGRQPLCNAHRATQPLFATLALASLALGNAQEALAVLNARSTQAELAGLDSESIHVAKLVKLRVITRMRFAKRAQRLAGSFTKSAKPEDAVVAWPVLAINGIHDLEIPELPIRDGPLWFSLTHAWWRSQRTLDAESISSAIGKMDKLQQKIFGDLPLLDKVITNPHCELSKRSLECSSCRMNLGTFCSIALQTTTMNIRPCRL
jgi:hypothetical protein